MLASISCKVHAYYCRKPRSVRSCLCSLCRVPSLHSLAEKCDAQHAFTPVSTSMRLTDSSTSHINLQACVNKRCWHAGASRTLLNTYSMGQGSDMGYPASDAFAAAPDMTTGSSLSSGMPMAVPDPSPPAEPEAAATMADPPATADAGAAIADPASEKPQQTSAAAPAAAGGIVKKFQEDSLERGPCAMSTVAGFVCQKAHVNGTLRIHWTPFKKGGVHVQQQFTS